MQSWQLQHAKAKLSEVIDTAEKKGPQMITRRGVETAVVVSLDEWRKLKPEPKDTRTMLEILQAGRRFEIPLPDRRSIRMRKVKPL